MQKKIVKGLILFAGSLLAANAYAIDPGFYMGLMMGPATNGASDAPLQVCNPAIATASDPCGLPTAANPVATRAPSSPSSSQFGSRLYFGYKFNSYAGFEGGFTYFSGITYNVKGDTYTAAAGRTARVRSIDFVGKLDYSYSNIVGFFLKGGVAAVYTTTPGALNITNYNTIRVAPPKGSGLPVTYVPGPNTGSNTYTTKMSPTFSIGGTYDFNQNWQAELSWTRLFTGGSVNSMNLYALGLSYHFVNVYCGQFLCDNN